MTTPKTHADDCLLVLSLLAREDVALKTRTIATALQIPEERARIAVKTCVDRHWAQRGGMAVRITERGRGRAISPDALAISRTLRPMPPSPDREEPAPISGVEEPYPVRRAAELRGCGLSVEEVAGILHLDPEHVERIRPRKAAPREHEIVTDAKALRGRHGSAPERTVEDFARCGGGGVGVSFTIAL